MNIDNLKFDEKGLIPVIAQDYVSKEVLMQAYANREAVEKTISTGKVHYYSRSRQALWLKGETSGHFQHVKHMFYDCDEDSLLILVKQEGAACHTGNKSCFYREFDNTKTSEPEKIEKYSISEILEQLYNVILDRKANPKEGSYTNYLFNKGIDKILKKIGEEAAEVIIAAKNPELNELQYEIADLIYHLSVLMAQRGLEWQDIYEELQKRR